MAAMGALIGGGIFDLFPRIRAAIIETAGGWVPAALDRMDPPGPGDGAGGAHHAYQASLHCAAFRRAAGHRDHGFGA
jgi:hypothetical protein